MLLKSVLQPQQQQLKLKKIKHTQRTRYIGLLGLLRYFIPAQCRSCVLSANATPKKTPGQTPFACELRDRNAKEENAKAENGLSLPRKQEISRT